MSVSLTLTSILCSMLFITCSLLPHHCITRDNHLVRAKILLNKFVRLGTVADPKAICWGCG
ncbi:hypothetical protein HanIR_Chr03g0137871 [Helianthus annuus]|nr:hypothetical protein HanIR_Chr03g0137871 [Helianthus annuus]